MRCPVPYALLALLGWGAVDAAIGRVGGWLSLRRWTTLVRRRPASPAAALRYEEPSAYKEA